MLPVWVYNYIKISNCFTFTPLRRSKIIHLWSNTSFRTSAFFSRLAIFILLTTHERIRSNTPSNQVAKWFHWDIRNARKKYTVPPKYIANALNASSMTLSPSSPSWDRMLKFFGNTFQKVVVDTNRGGGHQPIRQVT